jgi:Domain of unknown function (DUF4337)
MTTPKPTTDPAAVPWMRYLAMLTGALAAVAGYLTVRGTMLANEAVFHSTRAVLYQEQASDAWAEYQADSIKARVAETAQQTDTNPATVGQLASQSADLRGQQPAAKKKAEGFESLRDAELGSTGRLLFERDIVQYASMATQLGIALSSVAALTKRRSLFIFGAVIGLVGVALTGYALAYHFLVKG